MAWAIRQSTASQEVPIGQLLNDDATVATGLTIDNTDIKLFKTAATAEVSKNSGGGTEIGTTGRYYCVLDATDSDTLGPMLLVVDEGTHVPKEIELAVIPANVYDSMYSTDLLDVNVAQWLGTAVATPTVAGVPEVDLTHVAGSTTDVSTIPARIGDILTDTGTTLQGELDGIQADTEDIQTRLPAALVSGRIDASVGAIAANAITAAATAADFGTEVAAAVLAAAAAAPIDANVQEINDVAITGDGQTGTEFSV
jgi:hypothetical protein